MGRFSSAWLGAISWLWVSLLSVTLAFPAAAQGEAVSSGSGFFVNVDGWIVTNAHVLDGCDSATVAGLGDATDWKVDKQNDLAAVRVATATGKPALLMRRSAPRLGEDVAAFGAFRKTSVKAQAKRTQLAKAITYNKKQRFCFLKSDAKLLVRNQDAFANVVESLSSSVLIHLFRRFRQGHGGR